MKALKSKLQWSQTSEVSTNMLWEHSKLSVIRSTVLTFEFFKTTNLNKTNKQAKIFLEQNFSKARYVIVMCCQVTATVWGGAGGYSGGGGGCVTSSAPSQVRIISLLCIIIIIIIITIVRWWPRGILNPGAGALTSLASLTPGPCPASPSESTQHRESLYISDKLKDQCTLRVWESQSQGSLYWNLLIMDAEVSAWVLSVHWQFCERYQFVVHYIFIPSWHSGCVASWADLCHLWALMQYVM